jgi:hypothetical protein
MAYQEIYQHRLRIDYVGPPAANTVMSCWA